MRNNWIDKAELLELWADDEEDMYFPDSNIIKAVFLLVADKFRERDHNEAYTETTSSDIRGLVLIKDLLHSSDEGLKLCIATDSGFYDYNNRDFLIASWQDLSSNRINITPVGIIEGYGE